MDNERYKAELAVLSGRIPSNAYMFRNIGTSHPEVLMGARTNSGNVYTLRIDLTDFPAQPPKAFVTHMLYDKNGDPLNSPSRLMHTLTAENGQTRICHYGPGAWTPWVSIFKVYVKCRLWLEMYEAHLRTGKPIEYYLSHQN